MEEISVFVELIFLPGALGLILLYTAYALGFFSLPPIKEQEARASITFLQVVFVFAIYLSCAFLISSLFLRFLFHFFPDLGQQVPGAIPTVTSLHIAYSQMFTLILSAGFLYLFCILQKDRVSMLYVWKISRTPRTSIAFDFGMGVLTWLISFPLITVVGSLTDLFVSLFFGPQEYEQVAVRYLKTSVSSQFLLIVAIVTIVLIAPIIEEFLFRGFFQNFLKKHIGRKAAILLTAFFFAFFHFSLSQNLGNVPLVASLFILALFLGFIYERQQSLFASIGLHMTFNIVSVVRILLSFK